MTVDSRDLASVADVRALGCDDWLDATDAEIESLLAEFRDILDCALGTPLLSTMETFVFDPRKDREPWLGSGVLSLESIQSLRGGWSALHDDGDNVNTDYVVIDGCLTRADCSKPCWPCCYIEVELCRGAIGPDEPIPAFISNAAACYASYRLGEKHSRVNPRHTSIETDAGSFIRLSVADGDRRQTGYPDIDAMIVRARQKYGCVEVA